MSLENNTTALQTILDKVNALPDTIGASVEAWTLTLEDDSTVTKAVKIQNGT